MLTIEESRDGFHKLDGPTAADPVRWKAEAVAAHCDAVQINHDRVKEVAQILSDFNFTPPTWDFSAGDIPLYPQFQDAEQLLRHFLVLNSINYEYIHFGQRTDSGDPLRFSDGILSGAELATSRITQHWDELKDPLFLSTLPLEYVRDTLFDADIPIPRLSNRVDCMRSVGSMLVALEEKGLGLTDTFGWYGGHAMSVARHFKDWVVGFQDEYLKRAQLYVGMVHGRFQNRDDNPVDPGSIDSLTVFADYRVPQTMIGWGIIDISDELRQALQDGKTLREDSPEAQGLRAVPIIAADLLVEEVNRIRLEQSLQSGEKYVPVTTLGADAVLWAAPRQYKKAIAKGDAATIDKLATLFQAEREVPPPQIPTILL
jgi:hypothetical protein